MQRPLVGVVIGGRSDFNIMRRGLETLRVMGVPYVFDVISANRTADRLQEFARGAGERGIEVIIVASGTAATTASFVASCTTLPVIGVPIDASPLRGQDALLSMVMAPAGLPVATVGINHAENAAVLAAQILALKHPEFRIVLAHRRVSASQRHDAVLKELSDEYPDLCVADRTAPLTRKLTGDVDSDGGFSEAPTPEPPEESARIRPGATLVDKPTGAEVGRLVSTPIPQEPGSAAVDPKAATLQSLLGSASIPTETDTPPADPIPTPKRVQPVTEPELVEEKSPTGQIMAEAAEHGDDFHFHDTDEEEVRFDSQAVTQQEAPPPTITTKVFAIDRQRPDQDVLDHAMMVLLEGGIVALPTDTVYGFAVDATNRDAVEHLYRLKGRDHQKTMGVLIHHPEMLDRLVREFPPALERVIAECWPGALTLILPKLPGVLSSVSKSDRIGVRLPADKICLEVISRVGRPIAVRNASFAGSKPITNAAPLVKEFEGYIDCVLDGGECPSTAASTVLSCLAEKFEVLREGSIKKSKLKELLGDRLKD